MSDKLSEIIDQSNDHKEVDPDVVDQDPEVIPEDVTGEYLNDIKNINDQDDGNDTHANVVYKNFEETMAFTDAFVEHRISGQEDVDQIINEIRAEEELEAMRTELNRKPTAIPPPPKEEMDHELTAFMDLRAAEIKNREAAVAAVIAARNAKLNEDAQKLESMAQSVREFIMAGGVVFGTTILEQYEHMCGQKAAIRAAEQEKEHEINSNVRKIEGKGNAATMAAHIAKVAARPFFIRDGRMRMATWNRCNEKGKEQGKEQGQKRKAEASPPQHSPATAPPNGGSTGTHTSTHPGTPTSMSSTGHIGKRAKRAEKKAKEAEANNRVRADIAAQQNAARQSYADVYKLGESEEEEEKEGDEGDKDEDIEMGTSSAAPKSPKPVSSPANSAASSASSISREVDEDIDIPTDGAEELVLNLVDTIDVTTTKFTKTKTKTTTTKGVREKKVIAPVDELGWTKVGRDKSTKASEPIAAPVLESPKVVRHGGRGGKTTYTKLDMTSAAAPPPALPSTSNPTPALAPAQLQYTKMCSFIVSGKKCPHKKCNFAHDPSQIKVMNCRFGRKCHRADCYYSHPEGRAIDSQAQPQPQPQPTTFVAPKTLVLDTALTTFITPPTPAMPVPTWCARAPKPATPAATPAATPIPTPAPSPPSTPIKEATTTLPPTTPPGAPKKKKNKNKSKTTATPTSIDFTPDDAKTTPTPPVPPPPPAATNIIRVPHTLPLEALLKMQILAQNTGCQLEII